MWWESQWNQRSREDKPLTPCITCCVNFSNSSQRKCLIALDIVAVILLLRSHFEKKTIVRFLNESLIAQQQQNDFWLIVFLHHVNWCSALRTISSPVSSIWKIHFSMSLGVTALVYRAVYFDLSINFVSSTRDGGWEQHYQRGQICHKPRRGRNDLMS